MDSILLAVLIGILVWQELKDAWRLIENRKDRKDILEMATRYQMLSESYAREIKNVYYPTIYPDSSPQQSEKPPASVPREAKKVLTKEDYSRIEELTPLVERIAQQDTIGADDQIILKEYNDLTKEQ